QGLSVNDEIDSIITSPPYMNALDYQRDNRLRLWFIDPTRAQVFTDAQQQRKEFVQAIQHLARIAETRLRSNGFCVAVVGEQIRRRGEVFVSQLVSELILRYAPSLRLTDQILDRIPDVRRSRREFHGTKMEHVLVFRKS